MFEKQQAEVVLQRFPPYQYICLWDHSSDSISVQRREFDECKVDIFGSRVMKGDLHYIRKYL